MRLPIVTASLVLANVLAYGLELAGGGMPACEAYGLVPAHPEPSALVTSMFLHDPDHWLHLVGNMVCLAVVGPLVERAMGSARFLALYLSAGVFGGLLHVQVDPTTADPMVGASGAVLGILAVFGALRHRYLGFVVGFVLVNVWYAVAGGGGDVSFGTHLGGFAVGVLAVAVMKASGWKLEAA